MSARARETEDRKATRVATSTRSRVAELAARTPKSYAQALGGPDSAYWVPSIKVDFATLRREKCFINVTDIRPPGRAPPGIEQRYKIKYREEVPIALEDLDLENWKTRTIARGDRFLRGQHFDSTAAPVVHTPGLKCVVGWAVAKALKLFQADQNGAFYINEMDRKGIIVRLPPGFDPDSTDLRPLHLPALYAELAKTVPGIPQGSLLQYQALAPDIISSWLLRRFSTPHKSSALQASAPSVGSSGGP